MVHNTLDQQSAMYSYIATLRYMALACVGCIPIVFLVQKVKAKGGAAAGHLGGA
ncbi:MAG: hypothetical protein ABSG69_15690 [Candidatus Acidiferrum sp.]|jgi:hypothetical protein